MNLEFIWKKLEREYPLNTREVKIFSDSLAQGFERMGQIFDQQSRR